VCVMMAAMNVAHLPPALVRSGRVELWLEMKLPDEQARAAILNDHPTRRGTGLRGGVHLSAGSARNNWWRSTAVGLIGKPVAHHRAYIRATGSVDSREQ